MRRVRSKDTQPELHLRKLLWAHGVKGWRLHPKRVAGKPDLAWIGKKVAVFVDGAFWHGHPDFYWGQSGDFWDKKIQRNRDRDLRVNKELESDHWTVVRIWDFEIEKDPEGCVKKVEEALIQAEKVANTRS